MQELLWEALAIVGIAFMFLGLVGSIIFRHFRSAALTLIIVIISPPLWFGLWLGPWLWRAPWLEWIFWPIWNLLPPFIGEYIAGHPILIWLYFQIPLILLILWRSPWKRRVKAGVTVLAATGIVCFFVVITLQARHEVATAPHVTDKYLASIYTKHDTSAIKRLTHKRIVITGTIYGSDDGLIGGGGPYRMGDIQFVFLVGNQSLKDFQFISVIGTLEREDAYGEIFITNSRVLNAKP